jgi:hypothetical protein
VNGRGPPAPRRKPEAPSRRMAGTATFGLFIGIEPPAAVPILHDPAGATGTAHGAIREGGR